MVKLANRIEALKMRDEDPDGGDLPKDPGQAAREGITGAATRPVVGEAGGSGGEAAKRLSKAARGAIFREVVLAKVREMKAEEEKAGIERTAEEKLAGERMADGRGGVS